MKNIKGNVFFKILIVCGVLLFSIIAFIVIKSTSTVSAIIPNQKITVGTKIEKSMLKTKEIPSNTPKGYITAMSTLVGQKLKVTVNEDQFLYIGDVMTSWNDFNEGKAIPDDYIVTSIQLPSNRAVGGLITAGDSVDIIGVPNSEYKTATKDTLNNFLGPISKNSYGAQGTNLYWVLSNVKILETDSTLAQTNQSSISTVTQGQAGKSSGSSGDGNYYIVALSYGDYKKILLSEQYLDLHMNICPAQNKGKDPLLNIMNENNIGELKDSQKQSSIQTIIPDAKK